jgi:sulfhydrogenase subunit beta (sulfur reductase)
VIENAAVIDASEVLASAVLDLDGLDSLLGELAAGGRSVIGPTVRDGAIVLDAIDGVADLPAGWTDEQDAGRYRLHRRDDDALFAWAVGAHSWRQFLFPPRSRLWRAEQVGSPAARDPAGGGSGPGDSGGGGSDGTPVDFRFVAGPEPAESYAFVGVRSCDLHAIEVHDRVFLGGAHPDPVYGDRRHDVVVVAVHCSDPAGTCFCTSMGTGPRAPGGYDLALTELVGPDRHELLADAATERGVELLGRIPTRPATDADRAASTAVTETAIGRISRRVDTDGIHELLATTLDHPQWDDVAERCLACTNCTLVCPTCFCSTVTDVTDLAGGTAERWRQWDSCFTLDHSYLHGGSVRSTHRDRYRQWLTHKLGTWIDQFGSSGCVGCGRCIAWCPVGIDITAEVAALRTRQAVEPADGGAASSGGGAVADR